jgi:multiple sugar transport system substrate-binding protein
MSREIRLSRRQLMTGAAATAFGLAIAPKLGFAQTAEEARAGFAAADIDWMAFKGESLTIEAMTHPWTAAIEPLLPIFTELTGITVRLNTQSETEYTSQMPIKLGAKSAEPDVMMIHALGQFVSAGWAEPLDEYYADKSFFDAAWYDQGDVFAMAREFPTQANGQNYSMSITAEAQTLFANKAMLGEAGLAVPATMDELLAAALKLKSDMVAGIAMRAKSDSSAGPWTCGGFVFSYGGEIIDADGRCVLDSDAVVAGVEMYGRLLREAGPIGVGNYHWYEALNDFSSGAAALGCDSSNFATDISNPEKSLVAADAVYAAMPSAGTNPIKPNIWAWQAGINAYSKKKKAAFLLLSFLNSKPGCLLSSAGGLATVRNSAWKSEAFQARFGAEAASAALLNLNSGDAKIFKAAWFHRKSSEILDPFAVAINQVVTGQADARAALSTATVKVNAALQG